jgi:probable HAF family extracellular repeat protein
MRHRAIGRGVAGFALATIVSAGASPVQAGFFTGLGDLPGGAVFSEGFNVSADGMTVVGRSSSADSAPFDTFQAFRWTAADGLIAIPDAFPGAATATSADGSLIFGEARSFAFVWTGAGAFVPLSFTGTPDASADGSVVVGLSFRPNGMNAVAVVNGAEIGTLPTSAEHIHSEALGVSADGAVVVGDSIFGDAFQTQAFRWTDAGGMIGLGDLPGGDVFSAANDASADGSVIVGFGTTADGQEAFRWTATGGMAGIGDLPGGAFASTALGVSYDGSVVIGTASGADGDAAFIWDAAHGMLPLEDVLGAAGLDLTGWSLTAARGISADGLVFAGTGIDPDGNTEAWIASLRGPTIAAPEPPGAGFAAFALLALTQLLVQRRRRRWLTAARVLKNGRSRPTRDR